MSENQTNPKTTGSNERTMFVHEKLDVYHLELKFIGWVTPLLEEVSQTAAGKTSEVRDQLDRASLSALLNTAEGNGKRQRQGRAKFFDDARGSATECAACLDALIVKGAAREERVAEGKRMLLRIVSMLCGLVDRFDSPAALREESCTCQFDTPRIEENVNYRSKVPRRRTRTRTRRN
jgi:four helix bundle protein